MKKILTLISIILALPVLQTASFSAEPNLEVDPGYGGICRIDHWNPISVKVSNADRNIEGKIVVKVPKGRQEVSYSVPVSLAQSATKHYTVYVLLSKYSNNLAVELYDGSKKIREVNAKYRDTYNEDFLVVTVGERKSALNFIS